VVRSFGRDAGPSFFRAVRKMFRPAHRGWTNAPFRGPCAGFFPSFNQKARRPRPIHGAGAECFERAFGQTTNIGGPPRFSSRFKRGRRGPHAPPSPRPSCRREHNPPAQPLPLKPAIPSRGRKTLRAASKQRALPAGKRGPPAAKTTASDCRNASDRPQACDNRASTTCFPPERQYLR